jgi:hypothetical protein
MPNDDGRSYEAGRYGGAHSSVTDWSEYQRGLAERAAWNRAPGAAGVGGNVPVGGANAAGLLGAWILWKLITVSFCLFFVAIPTIPAALFVWLVTRGGAGRPSRTLRNVYSATFGGMLIYTFSVGLLFVVAREIRVLDDPIRLGFMNGEWLAIFGANPPLVLAALVAHLVGIFAFTAILRHEMSEQFQGFTGQVKAAIVSGVAVTGGYGLLLAPIVLISSLS